MKIIIVNDYAFVNGGAAKVAIDSAIGLANQGLQVVFLSAVGPVEPALLESGIKVICLGQKDILKDSNRLRAAISGIWNVSAMKKITDLLHQFSPGETIVHVHGWSKALSSSPIRVAVQNGFRVILTMHDYFIACPNGGFFNYKKKKICTLKPLSASCIFSDCDKQSYFQKFWRVIRQITQLWWGKLPGWVRYFIVLSDFSEKILRPYLPANGHIFHIPNPITIEKKVQVAVTDNFQFMYIGRVSPEKGVELFAQAVSDLNVSAVCIGDGPDKQRIEKKFPSIEYSGWISSDQVKQRLKQARCLIFPSLWYEVDDLIVSEAAALGIPAIVSDCSEARDKVLNGVTGLWFRGGDLYDLKDKIIQCQRDSALVSNLGLAAYQAFWSNPPTINNHVQDLIQIYKRMLNTN